jgi:hypothetical protein
LQYIFPFKKDPLYLILLDYVACHQAGERFPFKVIVIFDISLTRNS